jgi:cupin fold WbuC family metalloprotein
MRFIDQPLLDQLTSEARQSPRLRKNFNLHATDDYPCHRLFNAMDPGSYIRPHCHADPGKDETLLVMRGKLGIIAFDDSGAVTLTRIIGEDTDALAADIPHGVFHTAICLAPGTIFFEAKAGPYRPLTENEKAPWAPDEGSAEAREYLKNLEKYF